MGLLVMVLAWSGWSLRSSEPRVRWLSWLLLLSAIASLGLYGIGWILRQAGLLDNPDTDPAGGLYWLMTVVLPGYVKFRFPAKLWVLFTLAGSLLAAWQMQKLLDGRRRRPARRLVLLAAAGAVSRTRRLPTGGATTVPRPASTRTAAAPFEAQRLADERDHLG